MDDSALFNGCQRGVASNMLMVMNGDDVLSLGELIRRHVAIAYGGNQAAFARAIGEDPSKVNRWVKGGVARPEPEARRRLARELRVRHVDILVASGELWPDEVEPMPEAPHSEADDLLASMSDDGRRLALDWMRQWTDMEGKARVVSEPAAVDRERG